jgi:hypothetical protein
MNHEHRHHGRDARTRWSLPLAEHPRLELHSDIARMRVVPIAPGEAPWLEVVNEHPHHGAGPNVDVDGAAGVTRIRVSGAWNGDPNWWNGPWWESTFWEKKFWKRAFHTLVVAHVPKDVHGEIRSSAAKLHVARLSGCDLSIDTDAGAVTVEDVSGRLRLATQAGRIDALRISGAIDISTSAGAVNAEVLSLVPGTHRIRTNVGAVRLELARGMPVRIVARTTMGATRVDFPVTEDALAILDIEADLGAIRVSESTHRHDEHVEAAGPYRTPAAPAAPTTPRDNEEIERILERVASGEITPEAARDLLRALGVT